MKFDKFVKKKLERSLNNNSLEPVVKESKNKMIPSYKNIPIKDQQMNFIIVERKFHDDNIKESAKVAKKFISDFVDGDILELKKKPWKPSTYVSGNTRPELKKMLFEVKNGFKDVKIIQPVPKYTDLIVENRYYDYKNDCNSSWNNSSVILDKKEKREILKETDKTAQNNSCLYWNELQTEDGNRLSTNESALYLNPTKSVEETNKLIRKVKKMKEKDQFEERKRAEFLHPDSTDECYDAFVYRHCVFPAIKKEMINEKIKNTKYDSVREKLLRDNSSMSQLNLSSMKSNSPYSKSIISSHDKTMEKHKRFSEQYTENEYYHPGKFNFYVHTKGLQSMTGKQSDENSERYHERLKEDNYLVWSCCFSKDENNRGCRVLRHKKRNMFSKFGERVSTKGDLSMSKKDTSFSLITNQSIENLMTRVPTDQSTFPKLKKNFPSVGRDKYYSFSHPGHWTKMPFEKYDYAWSCCMNYVRDSKGCLKELKIFDQFV